MPHADTDAVERAVRASAGALVALAVHELNNRLAVMRETIGLLEDLAGAGKSAAAGTARAHASLDDQVGRALNVVRALSGLGGALGSTAGRFDAGATAGELLDLLERWARQRSLRIEREIAPNLPAAAGDPALLLCLLHRQLAACADAAGPGGRLVVRVARAGERIGVSLHASGPAPAGAAPADADIDRELARRLGGGLLFEGGCGPTILLATAR
jgi:signal transduction histidine kinase